MVMNFTQWDEYFYSVQRYVFCLKLPNKILKSCSQNSQKSTFHNFFASFVHFPLPLNSKAKDKAIERTKRGENATHQLYPAQVLQVDVVAADELLRLSLLALPRGRDLPLHLSLHRCRPFLQH